MMRPAIAIAFVLSIIACKSSGPNPGDDDDDVDSGVAVDARVTEDGWTELIARDWNIAPGADDTYRCRRVQVNQDMWVTGFRAIAPLGTHHTVVTISNGGTTGDYDCQAGSLDMKMLYASGVGTEELAFPTGVAMKIQAGQYVNLNLHLFNATDDPLIGHSGIEVKLVPAADVVHEADMTFAGSLNFEILPGDNREVYGGCRLTSDWHIFTLWPHMHQYAKHQKVVITETGKTPVTLLDDAYSFFEQKNYPMAEMLLPSGTRIDVTCKYNNNTDPPQTITFGDSSNQEMCFTGIYKWPAGGNLFQCSSF
ncbi:MAG TPA: hypothetical protein VIU61_04060 [Kofleriaceae bacterium]